MMLSRIAEALFWIGRYVERAEDTARILDVQIHNLVEGPAADEASACLTLLRVMGVPAPPGELDARRVTFLLAFDDGVASSIVASLRAARESARSVREAISTELWEAINATWNAVPARQATSGVSSPHPFFQFVKERAATIAGLTDTTMSRDDGWRFLVLGRSIERADMTSRLLSAQLAAGSAPQWVTSLRSCSAHEAFLRTYKRGVEPELVVEFLLRDRLFPRSVFHALSTAEACLDELEPDRARSGAVDACRLILGRARTDLEFSVPEHLLADLGDHLARLQHACSDASRAVADRYFRHERALAWALEG